MNSPRAIRPFEYIRSCCEKDLEQWIGWYDATHSSDEFYVAHFIGGAPLRAIAEDSCKRDICADEQTVVLLRLSQSEASESTGQELVVRIFDGSDARVRGRNVLEVARRANMPDCKDVLIQGAASEFSTRFSLPDEIATKLATEWISELHNCVHRYITAEQSSESFKLPDGVERPSSWTSEQIHEYLKSSELRMSGAVLRLWPPHFRTAEFLRRCESLLKGHHHFRSRMLALYQISMGYRNSRDIHISKMLADIICDGSTAVGLREMAYQALFVVNQNSMDECPIVVWALHQTHFPDDVDWTLVQSFADANPTERCP